MFLKFSGVMVFCYVMSSHIVEVVNFKIIEGCLVVGKQFSLVNLIEIKFFFVWFDGNYI